MITAARWKFFLPLILAASASPVVAEQVDFVLYGEVSFDPLNDQDEDERKRIYKGEIAAIYSYRVPVPPQTLRINTIKPILDVGAWDAPRRTGLNLYFKIVTHLYGKVSYNTFSEDCKLDVKCLIDKSIDHDLRNVTMYEKEHFPERLSEEYISSELVRKRAEFYKYFNTLYFQYNLSDAVVISDNEYFHKSLNGMIICSIGINNEVSCILQGDILAELLEIYTSTTRGGAVAMLSQTAGLYALIGAHPDIRSEFERQAKSNEHLKLFRETAISLQKKEADNEGLSDADIEKGVKALSYAAQWALARAGAVTSASLIGVARLAFSMPGSSRNLHPMYSNYLSSAYASRTLAELQAHIAILEKAIATLNSWPQTESVAASIRNMEAQISDIKAHIEDRGELSQHGFYVISEEKLSNSSGEDGHEAGGRGEESTPDVGNGDRSHGSDYPDRNEDGDDRSDVPDDDIHENSSPIDDRDDQGSHETPSEPDYSEPNHPDVEMGGPD